MIFVSTDGNLFTIVSIDGNLLPITFPEYIWFLNKIVASLNAGILTFERKFHE